MSQMITHLHPFNVGHTLTKGDVQSIDRDRIHLAQQAALIRTVRDSRWEILGHLQIAIDYINNQFVEEPDLIPAFVLNAERIIERFKGHD